ncbi:RNA polymerase sigma factor [Niveispirillum lacus]|nr:RNA polymerase sigma factor [Niveispirillum lacus]
MARVEGAEGVLGAEVLETALPRHGDLLRAYFRARLPCPQDAEDHVQEVYSRVIAATAAQTSITNWKGFLLRAAANLLTDSFRRDQARAGGRHVPLEDGMQAGSDDVATPERVVAARQRLGHVQLALAELDPVCREAFLLCRVEGMSHRDIANRLGIDVGAVTRHVERALLHLARRTGGRGAA